jgi:CRP-like cAMP-binding protein
LKKGDSFGDIEFFTGLNNEISAKSMEFTTLLKIDRKEFLELLKISNKDTEIFMKIKDDLIFNKNFKCIG